MTRHDLARIWIGLFLLALLPGAKEEPWMKAAVLVYAIYVIGSMIVESIHGKP